MRRTQKICKRMENQNLFSPIIYRQSSYKRMSEVATFNTKFSLDSIFDLSLFLFFSCNSITSPNRRCMLCFVSVLIFLILSLNFRYSTDEGNSWNRYNFTQSPVRVYGLLTEPGEKTTIFTIFGSYTGRHKWIVVQVNMSNVLGKSCLCRC